MIFGQFGELGELVFEIDLVAASGEAFSVETVLDTGFTTGWLAINSQDIEVLEWSLIKRDEIMLTAKGKQTFDIYAGKVLLDGQGFIIPVIAGDELEENLLGLQWLKTMRLVVDFPAGVLTLGNS
jgi:predicted aspartyl protease